MGVAIAVGCEGLLLWCARAYNPHITTRYDTHTTTHTHNNTQTQTQTHKWRHQQGSNLLDSYVEKYLCLNIGAYTQCKQNRRGIMELSLCLNVCEFLLLMQKYFCLFCV